MSTVRAGLPAAREAPGRRRRRRVPRAQVGLATFHHVTLQAKHQTMTAGWSVQPTNLTPGSDNQNTVPSMTPGMVCVASPTPPGVTTLGGRMDENTD